MNRDQITAMANKYKSKGENKRPTKTATRKPAKRAPSSSGSLKPYSLEEFTDKTALLPWIISDGVWGEARWLLDQPEIQTKLEEILPREQASELLTERTLQIFNHNKDWRGKLLRGGNAGRDTLYVFMRHWMAGLIIERWNRPGYSQVKAILTRQTDFWNGVEPSRDFKPHGPLFNR